MDNRSDLRTAVIGCGYFGRKHIEKFDQFSNLVAICDSRTTAFDMPDIGVFTDYQEIEGIDAVSIVTPAATHYEIAKHFLDKGVHVLVEKPMATTAKDALQLADMARSANLVLQPGHIERFSPGFKRLSDLTGGEQFHLRARRVRPFHQRGNDVSVIMDLMIHDIDMALFLGRDILKVNAQGNYDTAWAMLGFEDDSTAVLEASRQALRHEQSTFIVQGKMAYETEFDDGNVDKLGLEVWSFLKAIEHDREPEISPWEGAEAVQIAVEIENQLYGSSR